MILILTFVSAVGLAAASYGGGGGHHEHGVDASVNSKHTVNTYPVPSHFETGKTPVVDINSVPLPITLRFNTHSSQINAIQKHYGSPGQVQKQSAVDEPDLLIQNIKKPIIQEIREVISPYRHRQTQVTPVREKIETIIAKDKEEYGKEHGYDSPKYDEGY